jgi:hypothetical protein
MATYLQHCFSTYGCLYRHVIPRFIPERVAEACQINLWCAHGLLKWLSYNEYSKTARYAYYCLVVIVKYKNYLFEIGIYVYTYNFTYTYTFFLFPTLIPLSEVGTARFHHVVIKIRQLFLRPVASLTWTLLETGVGSNDCKCSRDQRLNVHGGARDNKFGHPSYDWPLRTLLSFTDRTPKRTLHIYIHTYLQTYRKRSCTYTYRMSEFMSCIAKLPGGRVWEQYAKQTHLVGSSHYKIKLWKMS